MSSRTADHTVTTKLIDLLTVILSKLGPWMLFVVALYYIRGSILAATREHALWPAWIRMMSGLNQVRAFAFIFGMLGLAYGLKERDLRRSSIERLTRRTQELEAMLHRDGPRP